ncbi:hypothetical protein CC2G_011740 [Coprinopsis cinerea AmutBmut pab1-1]|nr:hypothetical protein CC2G_011740 [Coprinopsis cinerea AmutBmut pab1-1]
MENPETDIERVVLDLTTGQSPEVQKSAVETYMTQDVAFRHPVCCVDSGPNSRDIVLKVYQWYRMLSPRVSLKVNGVVFDSSQQLLYLDMTQWFRLFFLPVQAAPARLVSRVELRKVNNLYYIQRQEDFYHTADFTNLLIPPLAPLVRLWLTLAAIFSYFAATVGQQLGYWVPESELSRSKVAGDHEDLYESDR